MWVNTLIGVVLTAYVDESMRRRRGEAACVYTLVAVLVADDQLDDVREALRRLRYGKTQIIHWHAESDRRLPVIAGAIAELPIDGVVTVLMHRPEISAERARRLCLSVLLAELRRLAVDRVLFESRQAQDANDLRVIRSWRRYGREGAQVRVDFLRKSEEPALWLADCVAGAFMWWLNGTCDHWSAIADSCRVVEVEEP